MLPQTDSSEQNKVTPPATGVYTIERVPVGYDGAGGRRGARMHVFYYVKLDGVIVAQRKRKDAAERYVERRQRKEVSR